MRSACVYIALVTLAASSAWSQGNPVGAASPQAPIGHRQPTVKDLPPDVARGQEQPADVSREEQRPESAPSRGQNARARAGGLPTLDVGPSREAAGRVSCAVVSSPRQAFLSRPRMTAPP
jgi:hypothetical protein